MIFLDSSVLISAFREEELQHKKALALLEGAEKIILLDYVILETITVLKMRRGREISQRCIDFIDNYDGIEKYRLSESELEVAMIEFQKEENRKLAFVDTCLLMLSKKNQIPLQTFDKELQKRLR